VFHKRSDFIRLPVIFASSRSQDGGLASLDIQERWKQTLDAVGMIKSQNYIERFIRRALIQQRV
jgi:hypothetical protein